MAAGKRAVGVETLDRRDLAWFVDKLAQLIVFVGGISGIIFVIGIFVFISKEGIGFITETLDVGEFFTSPRWRPTSDHNPTYGALALIAGTASVTGLAMLVAVPFSLGAAIYIAEFAKGKVREVLKVLVELLAAIPSVVWGFIGLSIMNPLIIRLFDVPIGLNVLNSGLILGLMAAPIMTTIAEDALKAVLMASGHSVNLPTSVFDSVRALTATIAAELGETAVGSDHYRALFTLGIFLFIVTFVINLTADLFVRGIRRK
jgi:phosphate transport system permease protein